jgi:hypothetical protein
MYGRLDANSSKHWQGNIVTICYLMKWFEDRKDTDRQSTNVLFFNYGAAELLHGLIVFNQDLEGCMVLN